ncbi:hypothetical protein [Litorimonas sp.]|uniref:hypothetical protein n=1 Tax=Litorimonas sp. TaxID=1892381 RepID=UPI003A869B77
MRPPLRIAISASMDSETLTPVADRPQPKRKGVKAPVAGRPADLLACLIASLAAILAAFGSLVFFLGFAANDSVLAGLISAFVFAALLGAFAVGPALIIAFVAWRGWKSGLSRKNAVWVIVLTMPWVILSGLAWLKTPLPKLLSVAGLVFSGLLLGWALATLILSFKRNLRSG